MFCADSAAIPFYLKMEADPAPNPADGTSLDFSLMERIADGDHHPFRQLVARHQPAVIGTGAKMLGNSSEAEDIAQTVFVRAFQRFEHIGGSESAAAWSEIQYPQRQRVACSSTPLAQRRSQRCCAVGRPTGHA